MIVRHCPSIILCCALGLTAGPHSPEPGYKARPWEAGARESYPARLTSQGVTIAIKPFYTDRLAASVFDLDDMVTRGIMPVAVVVFNDNDFAVVVEGGTIEWIGEGKSLRTLAPEQAAQICFQKGKRNILIPRLPTPRIPGGAQVDPQAIEDFRQKFLGRREVAGGGKEAGFLYIAAPAGDLRDWVRASRVYIRGIHRRDDRSALLFFEIDTEPSVAPPPRE